MNSDIVQVSVDTHKDDLVSGKAEESSESKTRDNSEDSDRKSGSEKTAPENNHQAVPSIKTLADLIKVCRDRGLQIYNDKKNIPDSDRLKVLPADLVDPKVHRSDGYNTGRRGGSVHSRRSRHLSPHKHSDSVESHRSLSRRTTRSYKSSSDWRMKSPTISTLSQGPSEFSVTTERSSGQQTLHDKVSIDYPNVEGDIEAEKILRVRMRKRVRRHRETVTNLVDVIKMKQRELELIENKLKVTRNEEGEQSNHENQGEVSNNDKTDVQGDWNSGNIDSGIESDKIRSETSSTSDLKGKDVGLNEHVRSLNHDNDERIDSQTNNENKDHVSAESFSYIAENLCDKVNDSNDNDETKENQEEVDVNNPNASNGEVNKPIAQNGKDTEIQEYVIQDGNTKLVLYRLKTSTALLENIENKNSHKNENQTINNKDETENKDSTDEGSISNIETCSYNKDQSKDQLNRSESLSQPQNQSKSADFKVCEASDYVSTPSISNDKDYISQGTSRTNNDINNSSSTNGADRAHSLSTDEQRRDTHLQTSSNSDGTNRGHKQYNDENCERNFGVSQIQAMTLQGNKLADDADDRSLNTTANKANIDSKSKLNDIKPESNSINCIGNSGESNDKRNIELDTMTTQETCSQKHSVEGLEKVSTSNVSNIEGQDMEISNDKLENGADKTNSKGFHSGTKDKNTQESVDSNDGKLGQKKPKRSLGNGFLVSGDDDDGGSIETKDKETNKAEHVMVNDKQTVEKDVQSSKAESSSQASTSGRGSKTSVRGFSSAAKQVLIATRIKQTFDEEKNRQANYVKEIGDTRKALRELYRKLRSGEDVHINTKMDEEIVIPKEPEVVGNCENVQEIAADEKIEEEVKSKANVKDEENDSVEVQIHEEEDVSVNDGVEQVTVESEKSAPRKVEVQSNDDRSLQNHSKIKLYSVEKKVDNEWDPNHPLFDQIKCGFKSNSRIHDTKKVNIALRSLRTDVFDISQVSDDNEYLKEAKRIYPQGFQNCEHKSKRANDAHSNGVRSENTLTKKSDPQTRFSPDRLVREKTVYGGKDSQKSIEEKRVRIHKTKTVRSVAKADNKQDTSTPRKKVIPRFKPKKRSNIVDVEEDKLSKDRNKVEQYQRYLNDTANLPSVNGHRRKNNVKVTPVNSCNSKKSSTAIPQAKFASYKDRNNNSEDDHTPDGLEESEPETLVSRETVKDKLARRASERSISSEQDVPLSKAVEIVKSRQKFYNENGEIQTRQRENRVFKLFREIQMIRRGADNSVDNSTITCYPVVDSSSFLMMDYDYSQSAISTHRTDTDLQKFLCSSLDNNMCLKSRSLYSYPRRRDKAWNELKQKLDHPLMFSNSLK